MTPKDIYFPHGNFSIGDYIRCNISCAFDQICLSENACRKDKTEELENAFSWLVLLLEKVTLFPVTSKEKKLIDMLESCPFVANRLEEKSRQGNYMTYIYILDPRNCDDL